VDTPNPVYACAQSLWKSRLFGMYLADPKLDFYDRAHDSSNSGNISYGIWQARSGKAPIGASLTGHYNWKNEQSSSASRPVREVVAISATDYGLSAIIQVPIQRTNMSVRMQGTWEESTGREHYDLADFSSDGEVTRKHSHFRSDYKNLAIGIVRKKRDYALTADAQLGLIHSSDTSCNVYNTILRASQNDAWELPIKAKSTVEAMWHRNDKVSLLYGPELWVEVSAIQDGMRPWISGYVARFRANRDENCQLALPLSIQVRPMQSFMLISTWKMRASYTAHRGTADPARNYNRFVIDYLSAPLSIWAKWGRCEFTIIPEMLDIYGIEMRVGF
jgi:hypothetical protein